jgi:hypothetical protein
MRAGRARRRRLLNKLVAVVDSLGAARLGPWLRVLPGGRTVRVDCHDRGPGQLPAAGQGPVPVVGTPYAYDSRHPPG